MGKRDNFSRETKEILARRASWRCSYATCNIVTVGPSEESPASVNNIGKAAHICGASSGPGSRRYVASMTSQERRSLANGIWLCANHADMIDRDESTFSPEQLRAMKCDHETRCQEAMYGGTPFEPGIDLIALGPSLICAAEIGEVTNTSWTFRISQFIVGDVSGLVSFIDGFDNAPDHERYILCVELGDGRSLSAAPRIQNKDGALALTCDTKPRASRLNANSIGSMWAREAEIGDIFTDNSGSLARVAGLDALPQLLQSVLSLQQGESVFAPVAGSRFFDFLNRFGNRPVLPMLLTLDVIRQASVASDGRTPLICVDKVRSVTLPSRFASGDRLSLDVDLEIHGVGSWQRRLSIHVPTDDQMEEMRRMVKQHAHLYAKPVEHVVKELQPISQADAAKLLTRIKR